MNELRGRMKAETRDKKEKKDGKSKDKKPGMLSGLFKRKDKKSKQNDDDFDDSMGGKQSIDNPRSSPSPSKDSEELAFSKFVKIYFLLFLVGIQSLYC